jgi:PAS domain S-box-containing protein
MRLSDFIASNKEPILQAWENFARSLDAPELGYSAAALRDHAAFMLDAIIIDIASPQSEAEQVAKSRGHARHATSETYAEIHASERLRAGFTIGQLVAEYRALRASVLRLWAKDPASRLHTDADDVNRFNEAIDQALAESVARFAEMSASAIDSERRRLDAILAAAPVGIGMADKDGKMVMANAENKRIWGALGELDAAANTNAEEGEASTEWIGWWADGSARHGQRLDPREWAMARSQTGAEPAHDIVEIAPVGAPDQRRTILMQATPIHDAINNVVGSVVSQVDITDQIRTQAALRESEAKFRTIANAMPQMVWSTLPDGFHDYYNQQWYDFTGMPEGSTDGASWAGVFHPDDQQRAWDLWRHSLQSGDIYEVQYRLRHHTGQYRWTLGRALPVRDEARKIIRWMGTCTDIHDQKLAEERLKQESQRKDEFLAMLAHELRNPLAPISSAAQLLKLVGADERKVHHASEIISRQVKHMTDLVDDLLDVSRVTRGLVELEDEHLELKLLVASAIEQARPLIEARGHHLLLRLGDEPAYVRGDRTRLVQVFSNLLTNAAKYTPHGGAIVVALETRDDQYHFHVSDNGSGMSASLLPYVFDLFTQGERTPDRAQGGLGLGLSLVKSITALHGGQVAALSDGPGKGSTFTIQLPRAAPGVEPARSALPDDAAPIGRAPLKLMIVDDNLDAAQSLAALLEMDGHQVSVHESADAALGASDTADVQVFILDIGLPGMNGYELSRRLRAGSASERALIIALTGYGQTHDRVLSKAAGFDHHFVKPIDIDQLTKVLSAVAATV